MPTKIKKRAQLQRGASRAPAKLRLAAALSLVALLLLFFIYMYVVANTIHIRRTTVYFSDLPAEFDNTTILYLTDLDLHGSNTPDKADALMAALQALHPDLLLLGGDYASPSVFDKLLHKREDEQISALSLRRAAFLSNLNAFEAPLGKYAVAGEADPDVEMLSVAMRQGGVQLLTDAGVALRRGNASLGIAGLASGDGQPRSLDALSRQIRSDDFVIVLAHDPTDVVSIYTSESAEGGTWADLILCGHTHGGQVRIGSWDLVQMNEFQARYRAGWYREGDTALLTSSGVGCEGLNLRLNTEAEVHFITLRRGTAPNGEFQPLNPDAHWKIP